MFSNLSECNISDLSFLEKIKCENLEILNLSRNNITTFNISEKVNYNKLKELNLCECYDLYVFTCLENINFEKLEILNLSGYNRNMNINIFEKVNFKELKELKELDLNGYAYWLHFLENSNFEKLEKLKLGYYDIIDLSILEKVNF